MEECGRCRNIGLLVLVFTVFAVHAASTSTASTSTAATETITTTEAITTTETTTTTEDTATFSTSTTLEPDCTDTGHFQFNGACHPVTDLKPQNLTITKVSHNNLTITWMLSDAVENINLQYEVLAKKTDNAMKLEQCNVTGDKTGVCDGLESGTQYVVIVKVNYTVPGGNLVSQNNSVQESLYPAQPGLLLQNSSLSAPNILLAWHRSQGKVDLYNVKVVGLDDDVNQDKNTTNATASIIIEGLNAESNYSVEIVAVSYDKNSSPMRDTITTITEVPDPPTNLTLNVTGTSSIVLSWIHPKHPNGVLKGFQVCYQFKVYEDHSYGGDSCTNLTNVTTGMTTSMYNADNLIPGGFYKFVVNTINDKYISTRNVTETARTIESVPGVVLHLKTKAFNTSLNVTWERPDSPNGDIVAYQVKWRKTEETTESSVCLSSSGVQNSSCSSNSSANSFDKEKTNLSYLIDDLEAYTKYNITVTAFTEKGEGNATSIEAQTNVIAPDVVTEVNASVLNASAVKVAWNVPESYPGPVNYVVSTYDIVLQDKSDQFCNVSNSEKFTSTSCVVGGLQEFWEYSFDVVVTTDAGESTGVRSNNVTTDPGIPGKVTDFEIITYDSNSRTCDATKITIKWTEPSLLDRNANITFYVFENRSGINEYPIDSVKPYSLVNRNFSQNFSVKAETDDIWELYAMGENNIGGMKQKIKVQTGSCSPPDWSDTELSPIKDTETTASTVTIYLPHTIFKKEQQGRIVNKGLIVVPKASSYYAGTQSIKLEYIGSWKTASSSNFRTEYKIALTPSNTAGVDNTFIIGKDENCRSMNENNFCNGPLPNSWKFKIAVYSCTKTSLCTVSRYVGPFETASLPSPSESKSWIIVLAILIVLGAAIGSFVFLWYRGIIDPRKWISKNNANTEEGKSFTAMEEKIPQRRPISIANYFHVIEEMHRDTNLMFSDQYEDLTKLGEIIKEKSTTNAAKMESNTAKNRWVNILPYDHSRVKLQQIDDDDPTSDYINANYMPGFSTQREYIATQGPLPGTVDDFWRMIWEQNTRVIVMLTQCKEGNRVKCEKYWPDELREPKQYGDVVVNPISISQLDKYNISIFYVSVNNTTRQVIHFHYLDFPDFSANVEFDHFIDFVRTVRNHVPHDMSGPMIVHCSAGVGRTGTFITIDRLQIYLNSPEFNEDDDVDIYGMIVGLRKNRVYMVQTESQYIMIHDCFEKMLADKKAALQLSDSLENLYVNQAFDPYPEDDTESFTSSRQRTDL